MILALAYSSVAVLVLGITASTTLTRTPTCTKLEGLYRSNIETVGAAFQAFEHCASSRAGPNACSMETRELMTAREELEAVFRDYLKMCASRLARRGPTGETAATTSEIAGVAQTDHNRRP
jgi:hypothetical protein